MNNKKIGKLIADLRKKQGLTQQDLGDKVGVGFRAVSKWERGMTLPDISIINELSKILGITSDELLNGELNKKNKSETKKPIPTKIKITISILTTIIIIFTSVLLYYNNKTYAYNIYSENQEEYYAKGKVIFDKNNISIIINELSFKDKKILTSKIKNYEYDIISGDKFLFRYGYLYNINAIEEIMTMAELINKFNINHTVKTKLKRQDILKKNLVIELRFLTEDEEEITKKIEIKFEIKEKNQ